MSDSELLNVPLKDVCAAHASTSTARLDDLAQEIKQSIAQHVEILREAWEKGKPYAVKTGLLLLEAKGLTRRGEWEAWVATNCCDERTAQRYMRIASHRDDPRLIAAEEEAKATGRALSIEDAERVLRKIREPSRNRQPPEQSGGDNAAERPADVLEHSHGKDEPEVDGEVVGHGDDEEPLLDLSNEVLEEALANIMEMVADDPWETLQEVVLILDLDWFEVAAWAQRQAEMGDESDEAVAPVAAPPKSSQSAPVGRAESQAEHLERERPAAATQGSAKDQTTTLEQHGRDQSENTNEAAKAKKRKKAAKVNDKEQDDLAKIVIDILGRNPSGLKLEQITAKVLNAGYKTQSENLTQAVYNLLAKLKDNGEINRDSDTKKYTLATREEREEVQRQKRQNADEQRRMEQEQREAIELEIIERHESLHRMGHSLTQAAGLLTAAYGSMATFTEADRESLSDVGEKMYQAADSVGMTLELENSDGVSVDATQACSLDEARGKLIEAEDILTTANRTLTAMKPNEDEYKGLREEGQKVLNVAYAIARMLGID